MTSKALRVGNVIWDNCRGINDFDEPDIVDPDMAVAAENLSLVRGKIGQKRRGSTNQDFTGDSFSGYNALARFIPGQNISAAEFHFVDRSVTPKIMRVAGGSAADELTLIDAISTLPQNARWAVVNGKLYWCYDSPVNRLHVFDPNLSTTTVRRVGLLLPAAPTGANTGSGTYAATPRSYRIRWLTVSGGRIQRMSNAGAVLNATPSGTGSAYRITQPSTTDAAAEGATHWRVEGSKDDTLYFLLSGNLTLATTTYDDSVNPVDYEDGTASPEPGAFTPPPSAKFIISTGDRLMMLGVYEAVSAAGDGITPYPGRVYITPVLSTTSTDDDERISDTPTFKGYIDIARNANGEDRALCGPMNGQVFAFQSSLIAMLIPTGDAQIPYRRIILDESHGAVSDESTFVGEDEAGRPCVYFLDPEKGPCRYGYGGLTYCGYDIQNFWSRVNLDASVKVAHGVFDRPTRTCKWWVAVDGANEPNAIITFAAKHGRLTEDEGVRGGWMPWTGALASARCSVMFAETFGATMARRLKPYAGFAGTTLLRSEDASSATDNGTAFRGFARSKAWQAPPLNAYKYMGKSYLFAPAADGVVIQQTISIAFGSTTDRFSTVNLTPEGSETRVLRKFDADMSNAYTFQVELGDAEASPAAWSLSRYLATLDVTAQEV